MFFRTHSAIFLAAATPVLLSTIDSAFFLTVLFIPEETFVRVWVSVDLALTVSVFVPYLYFPFFNVYASVLLDFLVDLVTFRLVPPLTCSCP